MSLQSVRQFLAQYAPDIEIIELDQSTATVDLAAKAHNVEPAPDRENAFAEGQERHYSGRRQR